MKKLLALATALALAFCLAACGQGSGSPSSGSPASAGGSSEAQSSTSQVAGESAASASAMPAASATSGSVTMGAYPLGGAQIEWDVLDERDGEVLLLARDCIDALPWNDAGGAATWDGCSLRSWLNGAFLDEAFTDGERRAIVVADLANGDDLGYGTPVGQGTQDRVFLLSGGEVERYLPAQGQRTAKPTAYAASRGAYVNGAGDCAWWLRSPGMTEAGPAYIASAGDVGSRAHTADEGIIGVRPAMWVASGYLQPSAGAAAGESRSQAADGLARHVDANGDAAYIPAGFAVSDEPDEQAVAGGLVVIAPDGSEYVWVPTAATPLGQREFGSYFSGGTIDGYRDEVELESYRAMAESVERYGGFYIGRYEASQGEGGLPASRRVVADEPGRIWVQFSPQDTVAACERLYAGNGTVQGFFPWGANWDTVLQWLIDSGCKTLPEVAADSTGWGNYSDDLFSQGARGDGTGQWDEAKANNIYDLAGNNWEWTQERFGDDYVMRGVATT